jgi:hypothetical protein
VPRLTAVPFIALILACAPTVASMPAPSRPPLSPQLDGAARLAELPPLHVYAARYEIVRPWNRADWRDWYKPRPPWPDGVLVVLGPGAPPLATGDRLAVVQHDRDAATLVVTDERCPPTAIDCLACDTRWAARIAGPTIDPDAVVAMVGPITADTFEFAIPRADEWLSDGIVVTRDGVKLVQTRACGGGFPHRAGDCVTSTAFVLGEHTRELSSGSKPPPASFQVFEVLAWPGTSILNQGPAIGGPDQVVIAEWSAMPDIPVEDANYWLVGPAGVVGSVRFDPPYTGTHCSFMSNPCWSTTAVGLPPPGVGVWFVVGPISDSGPDSSTILQAHLDTVADADRFDLRLGDPERPWAAVSSRQFACRTDHRSWSDNGVCFETVVTTGGATTRHVTYLPTDVHHAWPESICVE